MVIEVESKIELDLMFLGMCDEEAKSQEQGVLARLV